MIKPMWNAEAVKAYETRQGVELVNEPHPHYEPVETEIVTTEQHDKNLYARYKQDMKSRNWISFDNWLLETYPPQRTWVGLTDEEVADIERNSITRRQAIRAIEAKLKELNT